MPVISVAGNLAFEVKNDGLNQRRHEHDLRRGLFLGEGTRGYRRRIRGGAADREPTAADGVAQKHIAEN